MRTRISVVFKQYQVSLLAVHGTLAAQFSSVIERDFKRLEELVFFQIYWPRKRESNAGFAELDRFDSEGKGGIGQR